MKSIDIIKSASKGIVMGEAFIAVIDKINVNQHTINDDEKISEKLKFETAINEAIKEIELLSKDSEIFMAHLEVANDTVLHDAVKAKIQGNKNVELALQEAIDDIVALFESLDDEYLRERATDVKDVCRRIMGKIKGIDINPFDNIYKDTIVIAEDLTPSDTANMDFNKIKGFITECGGVTSHVSIMARSMEIPAFVGVQSFKKEVSNGDYIILDAIGNKIIINPTENVKNDYMKKISEEKELKAKFDSVKDLPATTIDNKTVELFANVGSITDVENALKHGAEGIGLFRSEFLYMENSHFPTEDEQFVVYKKTVETMKSPVIIRTLDIGGDKELSYYKFDTEENPFLGWRAIRISLDLKEMFKAQLKAILRASAFGTARIMYPMIISLEEFRMANEVLEECKTELKQNNIAFDENIETGIMIETPASVICAEELAKEVDFFSIGTNDLTQYILAVDRGNTKIAKMYNSFHPAVLRAIQTVINAGHKYNKVVGMCGEFASDEKALPVLLGMGLDEFSMASVMVSSVKYKIRNLKFEQCQKLAQKVCTKATINEIMQLLD